MFRCQIDARELAAKEQEVRDLEEEEKRISLNEQREKARIRHKNALEKERLKLVCYLANIF